MYYPVCRPYKKLPGKSRGFTASNRSNWRPNDWYSYDDETCTRINRAVRPQFSEICASGALATLPSVTIELLRESSAEDGSETPRAVADAALVWLRDRHIDHLEELCSRTHLLFVDSGGELRDCGELPAARGDAPELQEYRREAAARRRREPSAAPRGLALATDELGARERARGAGGDCAVLAAAPAGPRATQALLALRGRLLGARVVWRPAGGPVARGGKLGHTQDAPPEPEGERRAELAGGRCAHGAAALGSTLLVCGGEIAGCADGPPPAPLRYDRARVLRGCEAYDPQRNAWSPRADMRRARARFPAARLADRVYAIGGSDGHVELDSVDAFEDDDKGGRWQACPPLPGARSHAAAAAHEDSGLLYVLGGWAAGRSLKAVHRFSPCDGTWRDVSSLTTGRSQCAAVVWRGALWALGGCDAWRCLASTETLALPDADAGWTPGPPLPSARRSMGGCAWRGRLVLAGGSDGAASLRRVDWLLPGDAPGLAWQAGPPLRRARAGLGLAELEGALYAGGLLGAREFLACVEWLPSPEAEWTALSGPADGAPPAAQPEG
ncbi:hypothetical protein MSG28_013881 [Choristoneura fumiferana]|uniref:Uncharacterized protein n=1 Tax=Choristoneura fumiferana TaxID=7141 RepID=A0ACC0K9C2_CHOFU|nr:hypothetical protein MSG28_013881 [Choristoneura fumiferana]